MSIFAIVLIAATGIAAQTPQPISLNTVRTLHILGLAEAIGPDRKIGTCFVEKMQALGPFRFADMAEQADAVIVMTSKIPSGSKRVLGGRSPEVHAVLTAQDGRELWRGTNKLKKATTAWGSGSVDIECGLANGLANKLVAAIEKSKS